MHDLPLARTTRLLVEELDGDLLVYDQDADTAHALTDAVARVWQRCDGTATVDEIAHDLGLDEPTVTLAVIELTDCGLLATPAIATSGHTRRVAVKRAVKVGAVAASIPLIYSMAIGPAAAMASPVACGLVPCNGSGQGTSGARNDANLDCRANPNCQATSICAGEPVHTGPGGTHTLNGVCQFSP